jgi:hypothetical protein
MIDGGLDSDNIDGGSEDDIIRGALGDDPIKSGSGHDLIILDLSNDAVGVSGTLQVDAMSGTDVLRLIGASGVNITIEVNTINYGGVSISYVNTESIEMASGSGGNVTLSNSANATLIDSANLTSVIPDDSSKLVAAAGKELVLRTPGLTISASAMLDLADNNLIFQSSSALSHPHFPFNF